MVSRRAAERIILLCGFPASGKTRTAERLHAELGGILIRSCDVYAAQGISLPHWIRETEGFSRHVEPYLTLRDRAYAEMARGLEAGLGSGAELVIVDAVHGERDKRERLYEICRRQGCRPLFVWCRCADWAETQRRIAARLGRETTPEHEASDLSVYHHISRLWDDPGQDRLPDGQAVPIVDYETISCVVDLTGASGSPLAIRVARALGWPGHHTPGSNHVRWRGGIE
jgi:predicted kinase